MRLLRFGSLTKGALSVFGRGSKYMKTEYYAEKHFLVISDKRNYYFG